MIGYHNKFGFGAIKSNDERVVTITFDGISEKYIIRNKINIIDNDFLNYILEEKYNDFSFDLEEENFDIIGASYDESQNRFTVIDSKQNRVDIEYSSGRATTICSCNETFDCIHGRSALNYLNKVLKETTSYINGLRFLIDELLYKDDNDLFLNVKSFLLKTKEYKMGKILDIICRRVYEDDVLELLTAGFLCSSRKTDFVFSLALLGESYQKHEMKKYIKKYEKLEKLDSQQPLHTDKSQNVIIYYYFKDRFLDIIKYMCDYDVSDDGYDVFYSIENEVFSGISKEEKLQLLKDNKLDGFIYNELIISLDEPTKKEILKNWDGKKVYSKDLFDYLPDEYFETKIDDFDYEIINYVCQNEDRKFDEKLYSKAVILDLFHSYGRIPSFKFERLKELQNTKAIEKLLTKNHYYLGRLTLDENTYKLDVSNINLQKKNYLGIDEIDLFSYMSPYIYIEKRSGLDYDILHYSLVALNQYLVIDAYYDKGSYKIKCNYFEEYYAEFLITFIKTNFKDKLLMVEQICKEQSEKRILAKKIKAFDNVANEFVTSITKYTTNDQFKAKLEVSFNVSNSNKSISLKIGTNKFYVVPNLNEFINFFKLNERKNYGKQFSFTHSTQNLKEPYDYFMKVLLQQPSVYSSNKKEMAITENLASHLLEILKGEQIILDSKPYYLDLSFKKINAFIDEKMNFKLDLKDTQDILFLADDQYILDKESSLIYRVEDNTRYKNFVKFAYKIDGINIEPIIERFNDQIFPYVSDFLQISPVVKERFKVSDLQINAYFDYSNKVLSVSENFKRDGRIINIKDFKSQDNIKYDEYLSYLQNLGFENGICSQENRIFDFMAMDFSHLRELACVYLSENIKNYQVINFQKPVIRIEYKSGIMQCFMEDTEYDEEELFKLYQGMKLKKKYVLLKNNRIVHIENNDMAQVIDDLKIDKHHPYNSVSLPIYQALCAYAHKDMIQIDDYLKNMIDELVNFKNQKIKLPKIDAKLRPYQVDGYNWLSILAKYHMGGILADDMGLGKTLQIISLISASSLDKPCLIVCPKSLVFNWKNEFEKFAGNIKVKQIYGLSKARQEMICNINQNEGIVYITAYDSLRNDIEFYKDIVFKYIVLDEAQYIKNVQAEKSMAVKKLLGDSKFALTGTPIENNVIDLWSIFEFIMPGYFEELPVFKVKYNSNDNYSAHIAKKIAPFVLRRTKDNVLKDLPPKFETVLSAPMTQEQRKMYDSHLLMARNALNNGAKPFDLLPFITRLRQICVDPRTFDEGFNSVGGKLQLLEELIINYIDNGHKILIFSQFVKGLNLIEQILNKLHLHYFMITGETKSENRIDFANRFNASDEVKIFLVSLKAGGTGLNLVGADVVIHMDPWWNQAVESQATDRAYRIGQKRNVEVVKIICENTIEERVIELQNIKKNIIDRIISNDDSSIINASLEDIHFVLK